MEVVSWSARPPPPAMVKYSSARPPVMVKVRAAGRTGPETFLTVEEAGLIEMAGLNMHERFLARLTVSSLNLLKEVSKQEGVPIESLNVGKICDWFVKDKAKGDAATLKWEHGPDW